MLIFRLILDAAGVGHLIEDSHLNDRGSNQINMSQLSSMFENTESQVIEAIITRFYPDFRICGYDDTMKQLKLLIEQRYS